MSNKNAPTKSTSPDQGVTMNVKKHSYISKPDRYVKTEIAPQIAMQILELFTEISKVAVITKHDRQKREWAERYETV